MKPTTRTRAQNSLPEFFEGCQNVIYNNFILDFLEYLYDALHK